MSFIDYFFSGNQYIRVSREDTGPGTVNEPGYPGPITNWQWPGGFGSDGIDAALYSGSKCYFFKGAQYVRVTRNGTVNAGQQDFTAPHPISEWGWGPGFGAKGIDAALWSGPVCYFFKGTEYIRVTRGDSDFGTVDTGYPQPLSNWGFPKGFGTNGIKGALYSGSVCYFFDGPSYIRVHRGLEGAGYVDSGYPRLIKDVWGWPNNFGANGIDAALYSGGPLVPQPTPMDGQNNYFLQDNGNPLLGVQVTVNFDEVFWSTKNGYTFQLNGYSQEGKNIIITWQQFVIEDYQGSTTISAQINNWSGTDQKFDPVINEARGFANAPTPTWINQRSQFQWALTYDGDVVTGCIFTAVSDTGATLGTLNYSILDQAGITSADLAPIVAFVFNIGGEPGGTTGTIAPGAAGTITYTSTNPLTAVDGEPTDTAFDDPSWAQTGENANILFGPLPNVPHTSITQGFRANPGLTPGPGAGA